MAQSWPLMIDGSLVRGLGVIKLRIGKPLEPLLQVTRLICPRAHLGSMVGPN